MSNFLKTLIALAVLIPPIVFFVNWKIDNQVKKAVEESVVTQQVPVTELYAGKCAPCHGNNADGSEMYPRLNKYSKDELTAKLKAHKSANGNNQIMKIQAGSLNDTQITMLAEFITTLKPSEAKVDKNAEHKKEGQKLENSGSKD